jgi:hypothetical protein
MKILKLEIKLCKKKVDARVHYDTSICAERFQKNKKRFT